jgi:hypothetical protein
MNAFERHLGFVRGSASFIIDREKPRDEIPLYQTGAIETRSAMILKVEYKG